MHLRVVDTSEASVADALPDEEIGARDATRQASGAPVTPADYSAPSSADPCPRVGDLPPIITIDELSAFLRVNHKTVRVAIARGEIPGARRIGAAVRIHSATVLEWLAKGQDRVSRSKRSR